MIKTWNNKKRVELPIITVVLTTVFIFFVIYNISLKFAPVFTSARVAILLLVVYFVIRGLKWPFKIAPHAFLVLVFLLPVLVQYFFSGDSTQTSRIVHLFFYSFFGASLLAALAGGLEIALFSYTIAVACQALIIIISFFNMEVREIIDSLILMVSNYGIEYLYRAPGFTSSSGADLSVIQAMGVIAGIWFLHITKGQRKEYITVFVSLLITTCIVSTVFVGRTGLLISVVFIVVYILRNFSIFKAKNWLYILSAIVVGYRLVSLVSDSLSNLDNFSTDYFYTWAFESFLGTDSSVHDLATMSIPPIGMDTILGTGMVVAPDGYGNASGHDSGYIQTYYSMGLILSVTFYGFLAFVLALYIKGRGAIAWLLFITTFLIEIKEPFIFKYNVVLLLMLTYYATKIDIVVDSKHNSYVYRSVL
jgi:hypothetical protein